MHLVVAKLAEHGGFEVLTSEKNMVRLGQGGGEMKALADDAIQRVRRGPADLLRRIAGLTRLRSADAGDRHRRR